MQIAAKTPGGNQSWVFPAALACLFVSGMAGLVYQVVWTRYLALFTGHTSYAVVAVLAAFMGGLALGNAWLGRVADRLDQPLKFYGWLEVAIGVYALLFSQLFDLAYGGFILMAENHPPGGGLVLFWKFVFALLTVLIPTVLMGGTLPVLCRLVTRTLGELRPRLSALYFVNSAGAVLGVALGEFVLIRSWGLPATVLTGAVMNLFVGAVAIVLSARFGESAPVRTDAPDRDESTTAAETFTGQDLRLAVIGIGVSGFVAMLYEVAWTRLLALAIGSSSSAFAIMLITFISGIALGAWLVGRWRIRTGSMEWFAWFEIAVGGSIIVSMLAYEHLPLWFAWMGQWLARTPANLPLYQLLQALVCFGVMIVPTIFLGMTLPLVSRIATAEVTRTGRSVGLVFSVNTVGTVLGAVVTGLLLLPWLGLARTFALGAALNLLVGAIILCRHSPERYRQSLTLGPVGAAVWVLLAGLLFHDAWVHAFNWGLWRWRTPPASIAEFRSLKHAETVVYHRDGAGATVMVRRRGPEDENPEFTLLVNGKADASNLGDMGTQVMLGHIPALWHAGPKRALVVGLGSGVTCGALLQHPGIEQVDAVEISPEVVAAARHFQPYNHQALDNPRLRVVVEDAKSFLVLGGPKYDVIVSEPSNPWMAGVAGVFSVEFYSHCRDRLAEGGVMAQWFHVYECTDEALDTVVATFASVFNDASLWLGSENDLILIGSRQARPPVLTNLVQRLQQPAVAADLRRLGIVRPVTFLAHQVTSATNTFLLPRDRAPIHSDYLPVLEQQAQRGLFSLTNSERWRRFDERDWPEGDLLLHQHLRAAPLAREDYGNLAGFQAREPVLTMNQFRSLLRDWLAAHPADLPALVIAAELPGQRTAAEAETPRLLARLEDLTKLGATDPRAVRPVAKALMENYRIEKSIFHRPRTDALKSYLEQLPKLDPEFQRVYRCFLAEVLRDEGNLREFIRVANEVVAADPAAFGPLRFDLEDTAPRRVFAWLIDYYLDQGRLDPAWSVCQIAERLGLYRPGEPNQHPLLDLQFRKARLLLAEKLMTQPPAPPVTNEVAPPQ